MLLTKPSMTATGLLAIFLAALEPSTTLAAPLDAESTTTTTIVPENITVAVAEPVLAERTLTAHYGCYSSGETFSNIGSSSKIDTVVKDACAYFDFYNNHKFTPGDTVQWCYSIPFGSQGLKNNIVLMMKYKGEAASFTALSSHYQGGLQEYCYTAMQWVLNNCGRGGYFQNHKVGTSSTGMQYWNVKVDPNTGSCAQNHEPAR